MPFLKPVFKQNLSDTPRHYHHAGSCRHITWWWDVCFPFAQKICPFFPSQEVARLREEARSRSVPLRGVGRSVDTPIPSKRKAWRFDFDHPQLWIFSSSKTSMLIHPFLFLGIIFLHFILGRVTSWVGYVHVGGLICSPGWDHSESAKLGQFWMTQSVNKQ